MKTLFRINIIIAILALSLTSCYKDLGHYDYKDLRELTFKFSPDNYTIGTGPQKLVTFTFEQPNEEQTITLDAKPFIKGTEEISTDDLKIMWYNQTIKPKDRDTIFTTSTDVTLKANEATDTTFMLQINDNSTNLDYYYQVNVKTVIPYINSWLVLHGTPNNMVIGNAERKEEFTQIHKDIYYSLYDKHRFTEAEGLVYAPEGNELGLNGECLTIYGGDSLFFCNPFTLMVMKGYSVMMPQDPNRPTIIYGGCGEDGSISYLISNEHKLYLSSLHGYFYKIKGDKGLEDYHTDDVISFRRKVFVWDDKKQAVYHITNFSLISFGFRDRRNERGNRALVTSFPKDLLQANEFTNLTFLGFAPLMWDDKTDKIALLFKDNTSNVVMGTISHSYNKKGEAYSFDRTSLPGFLLNEKHLTATCERYPNLIFYASNNNIYQYDIEQKKNRLIYSVPSNGVINHIKFKYPRNYDPLLMKHYKEDYDLSYSLGISVNYPDNKGEIREILLTPAGELYKDYVIKGFDHIKDMTFAITTVKH